MAGVRFFQTTPRIVMGPGSLDSSADEVKRLGGTNVTIVTDPGLVSTGIVERVEKLLSRGGLSTTRFDAVEPDPGYEIAAKAADQIRAARADLVVGIGGGSPLDIAKVAAALATNTEPVESFFGIDMIPKPGIPTILIPTTAGTGSEVTPIAILSDYQEKLKKGIVSPHLFPRTALLDAELTLGLPAAVTAATGMDALIHAVEAYTSRNATGITDMLAIEAMDLLASNIRTAYANGADLSARTAMLEGSLLAGMAFANAGVTAVHAFAYPIGAEFHIPHGLANSIMLAPVMEFNMLGDLEKFADIANVMGEDTEGMSLRDAAMCAVDSLSTLAEDLRLSSRLSDFGVAEEHIPELAKGVMKVTRLLANNPRELTLSDAEAIYRSVL
ncbi:MAG: iron-containing alcohol dehydrogenase [Deltaproteobacteria bacterium]|nr:iron-containing alcohol dehydrogenase [Deltaproteobacteria bacterium]